MAVDNIRPEHYKGEGYDCMDVLIDTQSTEHVKGFCICNTIKYLYRHASKNGIEDVKKARWYIDKYIELAEQE